MKCLLVTDIFGSPTEDNPLVSHLQVDTDLTILRLSDLVGKPHLEGESMHRYLFLDGGFNVAISAIRELKEDEFRIGIGFSAGGSVLWKSCVNGLKPEVIFCLSSTRLRFESSKLETKSHVFFGDEDPGRPEVTWLEEFPSTYQIGKNEDHGFYNQQQSPLLEAVIGIVSRFTAPKL